MPSKVLLAEKYQATWTMASHVKLLLGKWHKKTRLFFPFLYFVFLGIECEIYTALTNADRKISYQEDSTGLKDHFGPGWYRFQGAAGKRMASSCPPVYRCNTSAPGWLNGTHPTVADGQVTRQVCFSWTRSYCQGTINIKVRNCGSFYVYYLLNPSGTTRYCSSD